MKPVILATASALLLAACQTNSYDSLAYGPTLTPVGQGLEAGRMPVPQPFQQWLDFRGEPRRARHDRVTSLPPPPEHRRSPSDRLRSDRDASAAK